MAKKTYIANTPIQHDGEDYAEGDKIELDDKSEAPALLAVAAVELATDEQPTAAKSAAKK